jgi:hypothetical protein
MAKKKIDFDTVREIGRALPGTEEGTTYRSPALKVRGKVFACLATHKSASPNTLVVRTGFETRDELTAAAPATYYLTDHYVAYPFVLVRLSRIGHDALRDLLTTAWRLASAGKRPIGRRTRVAPTFSRGAR